MKPAVGFARAIAAALTAVTVSAATIALAQPPAPMAQFGTREALGELYRITAPPTAQRTFFEVEVERIAPHGLAMPAPITPLRLGTSLQAFTGLVQEVPERGRLFFTGIDARGAVRLFEIDLISRQLREVSYSPGPTVPVAAEFLVTRQASKLYVQWYRSAMAPETDIYDGQTLRWLDRTLEFSPDVRAAGFEHVEPYLWTLDRAGRPLLIDTNSDRVLRRFDVGRWFGAARGVVEDAWRDLLLLRLDVGHDRYQVVDVVSGEIGPPLDLAGYAQAEARLVLAGRMMALIEFDRRARTRGRQYLIAIASGAGSIYDLRASSRAADFRLAVPFELPVSALGTAADPTAPGRLLVYVPNDQQRFDFQVPACERQAPPGDEVSATLDSRRDDSDTRIYHYRARVDPSSQSRAGAVAVEAGRSTDRTGKPDGWGVDLIGRDHWVRWTNGLGPATEDVAAGESLDGFVVHAREGTRPGIGEYRIQAATGLTRTCESDDRFLRNSASGYTLVPERVDETDTDKLAERLVDLVERACEIDWIAADACPALREAARAVANGGVDPAAAVARFNQTARGAAENAAALDLLHDAAAAVAEAASDSPP